MKTCKGCGETKELPEFYQNKGMMDGHLNKCKTCICSAERARRYGDGRQNILEYDRARAKRPERRERMARTVAKWKEQFPNRRAAQVALGNAVRDGRVTKLPCFVCGEKSEAHHPDYDAPLDVVWLCPSHHKQAHALAYRINQGIAA